MNASSSLLPKLKFTGIRDAPLWLNCRFIVDYLLKNYYSTVLFFMGLGLGFVVLGLAVGEVCQGIGRHTARLQGGSGVPSRRLLVAHLGCLVIEALLYWIVDFQSTGIVQYLTFLISFLHAGILLCRLRRVGKVCGVRFAVYCGIFWLITGTTVCSLYVGHRHILPVMAGVVMLGCSSVAYGALLDHYEGEYVVR